MRDLNIGVTQILEEINDLSAQRKISEATMYDMIWRATRIAHADSIDAQLILSDIRAEIKRLASKAVTFEEMMDSRAEQTREKKWQNKVRQDRRGKVK